MHNENNRNQQQQQPHQDMQVTTLAISGTVFVYACVVLSLVAVVMAVSMAVLARSAWRNAAELSERLATKEQEIGFCNTEMARLQGENLAFRGVFITTHKTAVDSAVLMFQTEVRKPLAQTTMQDFKSWLSTK